MAAQDRTMLGAMARPLMPGGIMIRCLLKSLNAQAVSDWWCTMVLQATRFEKGAYSNSESAPKRLSRYSTGKSWCESWHPFSRTTPTTSPPVTRSPTCLQLDSGLESVVQSGRQASLDVVLWGVVPLLLAIQIRHVHPSRDEDALCKLLNSLQWSLDTILKANKVQALLVHLTRRLSMAFCRAA